MRILAIERNVTGADAGRLTELLRAEAQAVWELKKADVLRDIWFTADHRAVLMLECAGLAAAEKALQTLPLYRDGLIQFEISELQPYDGLDRLMK